MARAEALKFGIFSDTHGGRLPLRDGVALDAILFGGDVYDAAGLKSGRDYSWLRRWVDDSSVPVLAVRGNHDFLDPGGFFAGCEDISGRLYRLPSGLWIAGVGFAAPRYYDLPGEGDIEPVCQILARMALREIMPGERVILLTHYPPRLAELPVLAADQSGSQWTYRCVADLVERLRPIAIVQGHVHEWFGRQWRRADGSLIFSPGPVGGILSIDVNGHATFEANRTS